MTAELGYFTLPVKDIARAKVFYGELFGWEFEESGQGVHVRNTKLPIGLQPGGPAEMPFVYFSIPDMSYATRRVRELGGSVRSENEFPSGLNTVVVDDQGTVFSLWQAAAGY